MTCIERFEADKAIILGEWASGIRATGLILNTVYEAPKDEFR